MNVTGDYSAKDSRQKTNASNYLKNKPVVACRNVQRTRVLMHAQRSESNTYWTDILGYMHSPYKQTSSLKLQDLSGFFFKFRNTCWKQLVILFYLTLQSLSVLIVKVVAEDKFSDGREQVGSVAEKNAKRMKEIFLMWFWPCIIVNMWK